MQHLREQLFFLPSLVRTPFSSQVSALRDCSALHLFLEQKTEEGLETRK